MNISLSSSKKRVLDSLCNHIENNVESTQQAHKHCAAIVHGNRIIDIDMNRMRFIINGQQVPSLHAEISVLSRVLKKACRTFRVNGAEQNQRHIHGYMRRLDMWVIKLAYAKGDNAEDDNDNAKGGELVLKNSKPCLSCLYAIRQYGIRRLYYSTADGGIACEHLNDINEQTFYTTTYQRMHGHVHTNWHLTK